MLDVGSNVEREIAHVIQQHSPANIVKVYDVFPGYIDMEKLDLFHCDTSNQATDIFNGLEQLHALHIVYIDLKPDNIGYSHSDQKWKIFDFDASGIVNKQGTQWIIPPPHLYNYRKFSVAVNPTNNYYNFDYFAYASMYPNWVSSCKL